MTAKTTAIPHCIGCDVDKHRIVIFDNRNGKTSSIANKPAALARFAASLDPDCFAICEALAQRASWWTRTVALT